MPKMRKPDANEPSSTYFSAASAEERRGKPVPANTYSASESTSSPMKMPISVVAPAMIAPPTAQKMSSAAYAPGLPPSSACARDESKNATTSASKSSASNGHENASEANAPPNVVSVRPASGNETMNAASE